MTHVIRIDDRRECWHWTRSILFLNTFIVNEVIIQSRRGKKQTNVYLWHFIHFRIDNVISLPIFARSRFQFESVSAPVFVTWSKVYLLLSFRWPCIYFVLYTCLAFLSSPFIVLPLFRRSPLWLYNDAHHVCCCCGCLDVCLCVWWIAWWWFIPPAFLSFWLVQETTIVFFFY